MRPWPFTATAAKGQAFGMASCTEHHHELISVWQAMRDARARLRAVLWLVEQGLIGEGAAQRFTSDHPEPGLP